LKLKIGDVSLFKAIFRSITRFTDIAHFDISKNGIRIKSIDPHDFCYVDIKLSPSFFEDFKWGAKKLSASADIGKFKNMLTNISKDKPLYLDISSKSITLELVSDSSTKYKLDWLEEDLYDLPEPLTIKYEAEISLPSRDFFRIVKEAAAVSREICFELHDHTFSVYASDQHFSYSKEIHLSNKLLSSATSLKTPVKSWAIIDYLRTLTEIIILCGEVKLSIKEDMPLRMDLSYRGRGSFTFIIANRKLSRQETSARIHKRIRTTSPLIPNSSLPQIAVTKFPEYIKSIDSENGVLVEELKHSPIDTSDRDYFRLANLLGFVSKKKNRIFLSKPGKDFVTKYIEKRSYAKPKLDNYLKKSLPEYSKLLKILSERPMTADDVVGQFSFSKNNDSLITKRTDVLLLLGIATWCNAIERKLGLYYFEK